MKVKNSLKSKKRDKNTILVFRRSRAFLINKKKPRFKVRQG